MIMTEQQIIKQLIKVVKEGHDDVHSQINELLTIIRDNNRLIDALKK